MLSSSLPRSVFCCLFMLSFLAAHSEDPEFLVPKNVKTITYSYYRNGYGGPRAAVVNTYDRNGWLVSTVNMDSTTGNHGDSWYYFYDLTGKKVKELYYGVPYMEKKQDTTITWKKYFYYNEKGQQVFMLDTNWNKFYGYARRNVLHDSTRYNEKGIKIYEHSWFVAWEGDPPLSAAESELDHYTWTVKELNGTYVVTSFPQNEMIVYDKALRKIERTTYASDGSAQRKYEYKYDANGKLKTETDYQYMFLWGKHSVNRDVIECNAYGFKIKSSHYFQAEGQAPQDPQTYTWHYTIADGEVKEVKVAHNTGGANAQDRDFDDYRYTYVYY